MGLSNFIRVAPLSPSMYYQKKKTTFIDGAKFSLILSRTQKKLDLT